MSWVTGKVTPDLQPVKGNPASLVPKIVRTPAAAELAFIQLGNYLASPARTPAPVLQPPDSITPSPDQAPEIELSSSTDDETSSAISPLHGNGEGLGVRLILTNPDDDWDDEPCATTAPTFSQPVVSTANGTDPDLALGTQHLTLSSEGLGVRLILSDPDDWDDEPSSALPTINLATPSHHHPYRSRR